MIRRALVSALAILLCFAAPSAAEPTEEDQGYAGRWTRVARAATDRARDEAVDQAIADMSFVMRNLAGPALRRSVRAPEDLLFVVEPNEIWLTRDDLDAVRLEFGGPARVGRADDGREYRRSAHRTEAGDIETRWSGEHAYGANLYRLSADGRELVIRHTVQITQLDDVEPIVFESRFARTPSVAAGAPDAR